MVLQFPIPLQYLPRIAPEPVEVLHDDFVRTVFFTICYQTQIFLAVVPASGNHIDICGYGKEDVALAIFLESSLLGLEGVVAFAGLPDTRDSQVANGSLGGDRGATGSDGFSRGGTVIFKC